MKEGVLKPRRVLMTTDTVGGVWQYSLELARGLDRCGIQTVLAAMGRPASGAQRRAAAEAGDIVLVESAFKLEWMPDAGDDVEGAGEWLLDLEDRFSPDIVHVNGYAHAALPWNAPVLLVAHSCVRSWWWAVNGADAPDAWANYSQKVVNGMAAANMVAAPTAAFLATMRWLYGPVPHGRVIRNGRSTAGYAPTVKEPVILSAGRLWDAAKNVRTLNKVAPRLPWPIAVAGDPRGPDGLICDGAENLHHLGTLNDSDMAGWLGRATIFALPARYEPFGLAVLEAALSGCALVLGDIPTLRELWDGVAAFVPPGDIEALEDVLTQLIADPELTGALARSARERGRTYSETAMIDGYRTAYADLLQRVDDRAGRPRLSPHRRPDVLSQPEMGA